MKTEFCYITGSFDIKNYDEITSFIYRKFSDDQNTNFIIAISSGGGNVYNAFRFVDFVKTLGVNITTIMIGDASSSASLVFLTGKKRFVTKNSFMGCHNGSYFLDEEEGRRLSHEEIIKIAEDRIDIVNKFNQIFAELSGMEIIAVNSLMDKGKDIDADKMIELGIAHKILPWSEVPINIEKILSA